MAKVKGQAAQLVGIRSPPHLSSKPRTASLVLSAWSARAVQKSSNSGFSGSCLVLFFLSLVLLSLNGTVDHLRCAVHTIRRSRPPRGSTDAASLTFALLFPADISKFPFTSEHRAPIACQPHSVREKKASCGDGLHRSAREPMEDPSNSACRKRPSHRPWPFVQNAMIS